MTAAGFTLGGADHAIIPVMLGDAKLASEMANKMLQGIYVALWCQKEARVSVLKCLLLIVKGN